MPATKEEALAEYQAAVAALESDIPPVPWATPASDAARQAREAADEAARQAREAAREAEQAYHCACAAAKEAAAEAGRQARNESREVRRTARDAAATLKRDKAKLWLAYRQACKAIDQAPVLAYLAEHARYVALRDASDAITARAREKAQALRQRDIDQGLADCSTASTLLE